MTTKDIMLISAIAVGSVFLFSKAKEAFAAPTQATQPLIPGVPTLPGVPATSYTQYTVPQQKYVVSADGLSYQDSHLAATVGWDTVKNLWGDITNLFTGGSASKEGVSKVYPTESEIAAWSEVPW